MGLLRRTLECNRDLAELVQSISLPGLSLKGSSSIYTRLKQYETIATAVVMKCPNLQRLSGPFTEYNYPFKQLTSALATRKQLRDMRWQLRPAAYDNAKDTRGSSANSSVDLIRQHGLSLGRGDAFLLQHRNWTMLSSLTVCCLDQVKFARRTLLTEVLAGLPSLEHLYLFNINVESFNEATFYVLPPLQTLSLNLTTGVNDRGLSLFSTMPNSQSIRHLRLCGVPIVWLNTIARILSNMRSLKKFTLVQQYVPRLFAQPFSNFWLMPYLSSAQLHELHWDITCQQSFANLADRILAQSILARGFPRLRALRAPNDPEAIFQQLCRPAARLSLDEDKIFLAKLVQHREISYYHPKPSTESSIEQESKNRSDEEVSTFRCSDLRFARVAAQARLEEARALPGCKVTVTDEGQNQVESYYIGGYLGTLDSQIVYDLLPDATSNNEWVGLLTCEA